MSDKDDKVTDLDKSVNPQNVNFLAPPHNYDYSYGDEFDLVDIWVKVLKNWKALLLVWVLIFAAGLIIGNAQPVRYPYTATIEVSAVFNGSTYQPIEATDSLVKKLENVLIPNEFRKSRRAGNKNGIGIITIESPADLLLSLSFSVEGKSDANYRGFVEDILKSLNNDLAPKIEDAKNRLKALSVEASLELLDKSDILRSTLADAELPESQKHSEVVSLKSQIKLLKRKIIFYQQEIDNISEARFITGPEISLSALSNKKKTIIWASSALGAIAGLILVFFIELNKAALERMRSENG